jgi:hypothetical protein
VRHVIDLSADAAAGEEINKSLYALDVDESGAGAKGLRPARLVSQEELLKIKHVCLGERSPNESEI